MTPDFEAIRVATIFLGGLSVTNSMSSSSVGIASSASDSNSASSRVNEGLNWVRRILTPLDK